MQTVIEVHGFNFSFKLDGIGIRDKSFEIVNFSYGAGTFYQKFKAKVPVELHDDLKAMKDVEVYVVDNNGEHFQFITLGKDETEVRTLAGRVLRICKAVHGYTKPVELSIKKRVLIEETSAVIVA